MGKAGLVFPKLAAARLISLTPCFSSVTPPSHSSDMIHLPISAYNKKGEIPMECEDFLEPVPDEEFDDDIPF